MIWLSWTRAKSRLAVGLLTAIASEAEVSKPYLVLRNSVVPAGFVDASIRSMRSDLALRLRMCNLRLPALRLQASSKLFGIHAAKASIR